MNGRPKIEDRGPKRIVLLLMVQCLLAAPLGAGADGEVQLYDTGIRAGAALATDDLAKRTQWTLLPEEQTEHQFKGDVVVGNGKLEIALRRQGRGAEVYSVGAGGMALRAELVPVGKESAIGLAAVKVLENGPAGVRVEASFKAAGGELLGIRFELKMGQVFVQTEAGAGATGLRLLAPCRFAVLPDFFADDMVVDATALAVAETELPSDNFLLHLLPGGEAMVMAVWHPAKDDVRIRLGGQDKDRRIASSEIGYAQGAKIDVAVLSSPGIWHVRDIAREEADQIVRLDWKAPYAAHWRVDWRRDDELVDSWEMLTQKPDGEYVKHGWYGQVESFGNVDWLKEGRQRWTTVLGSFLYPCWLDKSGAGWLQPLKRGVHFQGPAVIYPINRIETTPLEEFTIVDIMRATLGVGPCEYILDVEGQKKNFQGRPTCASRTILDGIYGKREQKQKRDEVVRTLDEVIAFVRHIRGRIEGYAAFSHETVAWLEEQKRARPELAETLAGLQDIARKTDDWLARRKEGIKTPEYAAKLVDEFRSSLVDYEAEDALAQCKRITAALVDVGGNQDELVGECRTTVKVLRQRAALAMAADPRLAPIAREIRQRTQQMLRNPTSYEAPRH